MIMNEAEKYAVWLENTRISDIETYNELMSISEDSDQISDRFYKDLQFGTGGLRGVMAAGTNRINRYTIGRAAAGLANVLINQKSRDEVCSVAIAYDSRNNSADYAQMAANVLSAYNIRVFLYESLRPTPQLSFTIRHLKCDAGIVITASHNPPQYNGFKVYGHDGGQITSVMANRITAEIAKLDYFSSVFLPFNPDLIEMIGISADEAYYKEIKNLMSSFPVSSPKDIRLVYSPIHGSGFVPVKEMLKRMGFDHLWIVESQQYPDGNFPTVASPNPESPEVFKQSIQLAKEVGADVIFVTDPDCDRIGVAALDESGQYQVLNGNQIGALLINFITSVKSDISARDAVVKTIVTSSLGAQIAASKGASVVETLTGFKYIGEKIAEFEQSGEFDFLFGYEESYGFLAGTFVRDKDAVIASALIALMVADAKSQNMTLFETLESLYRTFGYYLDHLESFEYHGLSGANHIQKSVGRFRDMDLLLSTFDDIWLFEDFDSGFRRDLLNDRTGEIGLPKENVIKIVFTDQSWVAIRPSGTEPKLKIYYSIVQQNAIGLDDRFTNLKNKVHQMLDGSSDSHH
jgi:phosphoglucomutase